MRILLCHNYYQLPGGEDRVFAAEAELLRTSGHEVREYVRHNDAIRGMGRWELARQTFWNNGVYRELGAVIRAERPDVLHCTNIFPLISPAAYAAARDHGVPVVQSLHNFRLLCPQAQFLRAGKVCERCAGKRLAWPGVRHGCYRGSRAATAVVAGMVAWHRAQGTWTKAVERYIALTEFARQKFIAGGLPADKIVVKPNFVPGTPQPGDGRGGFALFVGRLSPEKGVATLLAAWERLGGRIPLWILGDGPLADRVRQAAERDASIRWWGQRPHGEVLERMGGARFLVVPSICYETFGLIIAEAFAVGTPVLAARHGAMEELVADGRTGCHFAVGDAADLAARALSLWGDAATLGPMRTNARAEYAAKYTADRNREMLLGLYQEVLTPAEGVGRRFPAARSRVAAAGPENDSRPLPAATVTWPPKLDLLGVGVTPTTYAEAVAVIVEAGRARQPAIVACHAVHAIVTFSGDPALRATANSFDMITPDGQPVRWALNLLHRAGLKDRVYGPELMWRVCRRAAEAGVSIYLYGGSPEVAEGLRANLLQAFPSLVIVGCEAPPFRSLTPTEDEALIARINASGAGLVFIGLGCPKQDLFAHDHKPHLRAVQLCVGAAFDFHAGVKPMAPAWMQRHGLEWLYRLGCEPRRLWRRYLVTNSVFVAKAGAAWLGRRFGGSGAGS